jgi:hypothetical protein
LQLSEGKFDHIGHCRNLHNPICPTHHILGNSAMSIRCQSLIRSLDHSPRSCHPLLLPSLSPASSHEPLSLAAGWDSHHGRRGSSFLCHLLSKPAAHWHYRSTMPYHNRRIKSL